MRASSFLRAGVALLVVVLVAAGLYVLWPSKAQRHVTAYFTSAVGLYPGAEVRILGIKVGGVDSVTPEGTQVRVELHYDADHRVPSNAEAVIVNQTLVSDRYVQLTPAYTGGAAMSDHAVLPTTRTVVPVEVDDVASSLNNLSKALGPQGANSGGSLSRLLDVGAANLSGEGEEIRGTIADSAKVLSTLSEDRGDIQATIDNLRQITQALADNDAQVRGFTDNLTAVSGQLAGEKDDLAQALQTLGPTLQNVTQFIKGNRTQLAKNIRDLAQITSVLVKEKDALAKFLTDAPLGIDNLVHAYDPISGTLGTRDNFRQFNNPVFWICSLAYSLGTPPASCESMLGGQKTNNGIGLSLDISWLTALTTTYHPVCPPDDAYPKGYKGAAKGCRRGGGDNNGTQGTGTSTSSLSGLFPGAAK